MPLKAALPIGRGVLLLPPEPWSQIRCSPEGALIEGRDALASMVPGISSPGLFAYFSPECATRFRNSLSGSVEKSVTGYITSIHGRPFEFLLLHRGTEFELHLRTAENRLQTMESLVFFYRSFITGPNAMVFTDVNGTIVDANRKFLDLYGYRLDEVVGANPRVLKSGRQTPAAYAALWKAISSPGEGHWTGEVINRRKDGTEVVVLLTVASVHDQDGRTVGYLGHAVDITKRRRMEEEIQAKNKELEALNDLKSEFVAITSHDLKAPLFAILSYSDLIRDELLKAGETGSLQLLDRITDCSHQMVEFIQHLLDLEKINSGAFDPRLRRTHLGAVIEACLELNRPMADAHGISLELKIEGNPDPVVVDHLKMEQVFNNLLSNAIKFSPRGTTVSVTYTETAEGRREIQVADQGPGIPADHLDSVFDRYYQVKKRGGAAKRAFGTGVGLGLAICKNIIDLHGGSISVENGPEGGCRFRVKIPVRPPHGPSDGLAVLVVDPEGLFASNLDPVLKARSIDHFTVRTLQELRRVYAFEKPELIFLNGLEARMEIVDFLKSLRQPDAHLPLVVQVGPEVSSPSPSFRNMQPPLGERTVQALLEEAWTLTLGNG
jgi:PAS domain S-box-containing protein